MTEWCLAHPWMTLLLALTAMQTIYACCYVGFLVVNRCIRGWSIAKHGWPPLHCDADGEPTRKRRTETVND